MVCNLNCGHNRTVLEISATDIAPESANVSATFAYSSLQYKGFQCNRSCNQNCNWKLCSKIPKPNKRYILHHVCPSFWTWNNTVLQDVVNDRITYCLKHVAGDADECSVCAGTGKCILHQWFVKLNCFGAIPTWLMKPNPKAQEIYINFVASVSKPMISRCRWILVDILFFE